MFGSNYTSVDKGAEYPKNILMLNYAVDESASEGDMLLYKFARALTEFVGGSLGTVDIQKEWEASRPEEANQAGLTEFLNLTWTTLTTKEQAALVRDPMFKDYAGESPLLLPISTLLT